MKIGITERGDAGIDLQWVPKVRTGMVDGAVLITKNITDIFINNVMDCFNAGCKIIVHATCTGWGGSFFEPNVPDYKSQINNMVRLVDEGFPLANCVLRIDPIIPSDEGLLLVGRVIEYAQEKGILPCARIRISVYDEYRHVKDRLHKAGYQSFCPDDQFYVSDEQFKQVAEVCSRYPYFFDACAEPELSKYAVNIRNIGCVSKQDFEILGLKMLEVFQVNRQNRNGCLCLSCKTELLTEKHQCPHKCIYCYWK